jgi:hypothetical protein
VPDEVSDEIAKTELSSVSMPIKQLPYHPVWPNPLWRSIIRVPLFGVVVAFVIMDEGCAGPREVPAGMARIEEAHNDLRWNVPDVDATFGDGELDVPRGIHTVFVRYGDAFEYTEQDVVFTSLFVEGHRYKFKKVFTWPCSFLRRFGPGCSVQVAIWLEDTADGTVVAGKRPVEAEGWWGGLDLPHFP